MTMLSYMELQKRLWFHDIRQSEVHADLGFSYYTCGRVFNGMHLAISCQTIETMSNYVELRTGPITDDDDVVFTAEELYYRLRHGGYYLSRLGRHTKIPHDTLYRLKQGVRLRGRYLHLDTLSRYFLLTDNQWRIPDDITETILNWQRAEIDQAETFVLQMMSKKMPACQGG